VEFNKRKFNIIVIFTVCLICFVVAFTSVSLSSATNTDLIPNTNADAEEDKGPDGKLPEELPPVKIENAPVFTARQKWQCLNYAVNNLNKYDYKITWSQTVPNPLDNQIIKKNIFKISNKYYLEIAASGYETFTNFAYIDTETAVLNLNGNKITLSYNDYINQWAGGFHLLPYSLTQPTCDITKFESDPLKDYYSLDVSIKSLQFPNYIKLMTKSSSSAKDPQIDSISLNIKIDKESGTIKSMKIVEKYSISTVIGRVACVSTINLFYTYSNFATSSAVNTIKTNLEK
jgi:hypothetical protein